MEGGFNTTSSSGIFRMRFYRLGRGPTSRSGLVSSRVLSPTLPHPSPDIYYCTLEFYEEPCYIHSEPELVYRFYFTRVLYFRVLCCGDREISIPFWSR